MVIKPEQIVFPNYFKEIAPYRVKALLTLNMLSILRRLHLPYVEDPKIRHIATANFFSKLVEAMQMSLAQELARKQGKDAPTKEEIDIAKNNLKIYIGGGVVRTLLAEIYEQLYKEMQQQPSQKFRDEHEKILASHPDSEDKKQARNILMNALRSPEFKMTHSYITEKSPITGTEVLGVGSDLDIYYELTPKYQEEYGNLVEKSGEIFINSTEKVFELRDMSESVKHSLIPIADVKEINSQVGLALSQGGSLLDTLAFELDEKLLKESNRIKISHIHRDLLREPKRKLTDSVERPLSIIDDFIYGYLDYIKSPNGHPASQKQTIRGLRALLELPFINFKDPNLITMELTGILDGIKDGSLKTLNPLAIEQITKMIRNARLSAANNRVYKAAENSALNILRQIVTEIQSNDPTIIIPEFTEYLDLERTITGEHASELESYHMNLDDFISNYTAKREQPISQDGSSVSVRDKQVLKGTGLLYHCTTSVKNIMPMLRHNFFKSTGSNGTTAIEGPGFYTTKDRTEAVKYAYARKGHTRAAIVIELQINSELEKKPIIINWVDVNSTLKQKLENEAIKLNLHVFDMLRMHYGMDVVIVEEKDGVEMSYFPLIHNTKILKPQKSSGPFIDSVGEQLFSKDILNLQNNELPSFYKEIVSYLRLLQFAKVSGAKVNIQYIQRIIDFANTTYVTADNNPGDEYPIPLSIYLYPDLLTTAKLYNVSINPEDIQNTITKYNAAFRNFYQEFKVDYSDQAKSNFSETDLFLNYPKFISGCLAYNIQPDILSEHDISAFIRDNFTDNDPYNTISYLIHSLPNYHFLYPQLFGKTELLVDDNTAQKYFRRWLFNIYLEKTGDKECLKVENVIRMLNNGIRFSDSEMIQSAIQKGALEHFNFSENPLDVAITENNTKVIDLILNRPNKKDILKIILGNCSQDYIYIQTFLSALFFKRNIDLFYRLIDFVINLNPEPSLTKKFRFEEIAQLLDINFEDSHEKYLQFYKWFLIKTCNSMLCSDTDVNIFKQVYSKLAIYFPNDQDIIRNPEILSSALKSYNVDTVEYILSQVCKKPNTEKERQQIENLIDELKLAADNAYSPDIEALCNKYIDIAKSLLPKKRKAFFTKHSMQPLGEFEANEYRSDSTHSKKKQPPFK